MPDDTRSERLPLPGPSFLRELDVRVRDRSLRVGMGRPSTTDGDWWLAVMWLADDDGVVSWREVAPRSGPPPDPPLVRLGPILSGALSGLIREEGGRLGVRLGPIAAPHDPTQPWRSPAAVRAAFLFEPLRVATMAPNELSSTVLAAFAGSVESLAGR
ncbi:MAG TPA: hypothetical protein VGK63_04930 [Candidatus Limnocylindrales bacterium]